MSEAEIRADEREKHRKGCDGAGCCEDHYDDGHRDGYKKGQAELMKELMKNPCVHTREAIKKASESLSSRRGISNETDIKPEKPKKHRRRNGYAGRL